MEDYELLVKEYLHLYYDLSILEYLKKRTTLIDIPHEEGLSFYSCFEKMKDDILIDIKLVVPKVHDLQSGCVLVHEYKHGIDLYPYIGSNIPDIDYEERAKDEEELFKNYVLSTKQK